MNAPRRTISTVSADLSGSASLLVSEKVVRGRARHGLLYLFFVDGISVLLLFLLHFLLSPQVLFGATLTVASTLISYFASKEAAATGHWDGSMSWVLLSLAVVMPMVATIKVAFDRRERALEAIAVVRSNCYKLYLAHAEWDWKVVPPGDEGRDMCVGKDWLEHADAALVELLGVGEDLSRFLTLPGFTRARHRVTKAGREESCRTAEVSRAIYESLLKNRITRLTLLAEDLKKAGMALPEMIRIQKWLRVLCGALEELRVLKVYRTPQALRSFARIGAAFLPPLYGPAFAQLARDTDSLTLGIFFGLIASVALTALFEANSFLEDPFLSYLTMDGIDVYGELVVLHRQELMGTRSDCFPNATPFIRDGGLNLHTSSCRSEQAADNVSL